MGSGASSPGPVQAKDALAASVVPKGPPSVKTMGKLAALSFGRRDTDETPPRPWAVQDNFVQQTFRKALKERIQCLCEGGSACHREDPCSQRGRNPIPNLHSNWVTDDLLAMARPWQSNLVDPSKGLMLEFRRSKIGLVLNLQELGEHSKCGPGVLPHTGFSYDPESFMAAGIHVVNGAWQDMGCPTMSHLMNIVQVMSHFLRRGKKVAVHCHAGLGRTGLAIAASLVYERKCTASEAVTLVRRKRPGALQTRGQEHMVHTFERRLEYLRHQFVVAPAKRSKGVRMAAALLSHHGAGAAHEPAPRRRTGSPRISRSSSGNNIQDSNHQHSSGNLPLLAQTTGSEGSTAMRMGDAAIRMHTINKFVSKRPVKRPGIIRAFTAGTAAPLKDLEDALARQRELVGGEERQLLYHVPKLVDYVHRELETRLARWKNSKDRGPAPHLPILPLHEHMRRYLEARRNGSFPGQEAQHNGYVSLEKAKREVNEGNWDVINLMGTPVMLELFELWLTQLAKPGPEVQTMFVNAVGVIRTRSITASSQQVMQKASKHLSTTMRHYMHRLIQFCQTLSDSDDSLISESVVHWLVDSISRSSTGRDDSVSSGHSSVVEALNDTESVMCEFFMFAGESKEATDAILPERRFCPLQSTRAMSLAPSTSSTAKFDTGQDSPFGYKLKAVPSGQPLCLPCDENELPPVGRISGKRSTENALTPSAAEATIGDAVHRGDDRQAQPLLMNRRADSTPSRMKLPSLPNAPSMRLSDNSAVSALRAAQPKAALQRSPRGSATDRGPSAQRLSDNDTRQVPDGQTNGSAEKIRLLQAASASSLGGIARESGEQEVIVAEAEKKQDRPEICRLMGFDMRSYDIQPDGADLFSIP